MIKAACKEFMLLEKGVNAKALNKYVRKLIDQKGNSTSFQSVQSNASTNTVSIQEESSRVVYEEPSIDFAMLDFLMEWWC